ncbi:hypothetical protein DFP72DRAFT_1065285 [Ephemerocybe angulata]|uniref:Uncharacterized protein n=1 Tax=Ephemerocybe angulata TaxID=980116 RepID=A0A8H6I3H2_9AGAR|nr:hypothetical protein DFP72DRAFT_1065285 [Tulosesus angulatus]
MSVRSLPAAPAAENLSWFKLVVRNRRWFAVHSSVGPCSLIIAYGHVFQALDLVGVVACGSPARSPRLQPPPLLAPNDAEALDRSTLACIDAEFISVCCPAPVKPTPTPTVLDCRDPGACLSTSTSPPTMPNF